MERGRRALILVLALGACRNGDGAPRSGPPARLVPRAGSELHDDQLDGLHAFEEQRHAKADFTALPTADGGLGADPYAVRKLPGRDQWVGILKGSAALVLLDGEGKELARAATPAMPTALAVDDQGTIFVGGAQAPTVAIFGAGPAAAPALTQLGSVTLPGFIGVRDLARSGAMLLAIDDLSGGLSALELGKDPAHPRGPARAIAHCRGPSELAVLPGFVVTNCLLDHTVEVRTTDGKGVPAAAPIARLTTDGPMWSVAATALASGDLVVATGGVEDHPLDRSEGAFGYVDSFLYVYVVPTSGAAVRKAAVNLSEQGVVTPKWMTLAAVAGGGLELDATGYGSDHAVTVRFAADLTAAPTITARAMVPGITDGAGRLAADPLLDAWVVLDDGGPRLAPIAPPPAAANRSLESKLGEALFFTKLMAPWNSSLGPRSRFTCETCHFEGYGDGRIHYTGRMNGTQQVHATTKPLYGLFNNRPHFTRALDLSMTQMVNNEFRVANKLNGHDPWFTLATDDFPWLSAFGQVPATLDPITLRRSLMTFLMDFNHPRNPLTAGRTSFTPLERQGAELFRDRCAACHAARLVTDDPKTAVAFDRWESLIFSPTGPIVWASAGYQKTGIEPYVHDDGARTTSLRRLAHKHPYFTNGSADTLAALLEGYAWTADRSYHGEAPADAKKLGPAERDALLGFLALL